MEDSPIHQCISEERVVEERLSASVKSRDCVSKTPSTDHTLGKIYKQYNFDSRVTKRRKTYKIKQKCSKIFIEYEDSYRNDAKRQLRNLLIEGICMDESMPKLYETHKFLTNSSDRVNGFLGELMNSRIVEFTQIHDHQKTANESNSTKSLYNNSKIPKIKSSKNENLSIRINELKANILRKQCLYDNAKSKTQIIKKLQQYTEFRQNNINAKQEIHDAYAYDLEQYVVSLRELKSELEVTNKLDLSNNSDDQVAKYKNIVNLYKFYILI